MEAGLNMKCLEKKSSKGSCVEGTDLYEGHKLYPVGRNRKSQTLLLINY